MIEAFDLAVYANVFTNAMFEQPSPMFSAETGKYVLMSSLDIIPLLNFDVDRLRGKEIRNAILSMQVAEDDFPLVVEVTTIADHWDGDGTTLFNSGNGEPWGGGKWLTDFIMGNGNSMHEKREAEFNERTGVISVNIPVIIICAMIYGQSCGFGLIDRKSKTFAMDETGWLFTKKFHGCDEGFMAPKLEIEYEEPEAGEGSGEYSADNTVITVSNGMADSPAVHASVKTNPARGMPFIPQELHQDDDSAIPAFSIRKEAFTLFVLDELSKVNPVSGNVLEYDPTAYRTGDEGNIATYGTGIFDGTTVRLVGVAGEKLAFQMVIRNDTVEDMEFHVQIERNPLLPCSIFASKAWYLSADDAW